MEDQQDKEIVSDSDEKGKSANETFGERAIEILLLQPLNPLKKLSFSILPRREYEQ